MLHQRRNGVGSSQRCAQLCKRLPRALVRARGVGYFIAVALPVASAVGMLGTMLSATARGPESPPVTGPRALEDGRTPPTAKEEDDVDEFVVMGVVSCIPLLGGVVRGAGRLFPSLQHAPLLHTDLDVFSCSHSHCAPPPPGMGPSRPPVPR